MSKIQYKLSNGKQEEVEVNATIAETIAIFEREDKNAARKQRRRNEVSIEAMCAETGWEPTDNSVDIEADYIAREEKEMLLKAIAELSKKQQQLVRLYYYEDKTESEIATLFGVSQPAIHQQLTTIKTTLKKYFEKFYA